jgi:HAD superfamily hydrolase (TIGR01662 family)
MAKIKLIVFDVDGTLAKKFTLDLLPGVRQFFELLFKGGCPHAPKAAIATNQGGVGMRHWMEVGGFGKPKTFPTHQEIDERMQALVSKLGGESKMPVYASYRLLTKQGKWTPVPVEEQDNPRWRREWRKPLPGMLLQAMKEAGTSPHETLFVGDREDDRGAAQAAGCAFEWAEDFFGKPWHSCEELERLQQG